MSKKPTHFEKAFMGFDIYHVFTCRECGKPCVQKVNHYYGQNPRKVEGLQPLPDFDDICECSENQVEDED